MNRITLTIETPADARGFRTLALLLKRLLRTYGMKCVRIEPTTSDKGN